MSSSLFTPLPAESSAPDGVSTPPAFALTPSARGLVDRSPDAGRLSGPADASIASRVPLVGAPPRTDAPAVSKAVSDLSVGAERARPDVIERIELARQCLAAVRDMAHEWVAAACRFKGLSDGHRAVAEEVTSGPVAVARYLRLLIQTFESLCRAGVPRFAGAVHRRRDGQLEVPVFPGRGMFDAISLPGFSAVTRLDPSIGQNDLLAHWDRLIDRGFHPGEVVAVLAAGNVSSLPVTDALHQALIEGRQVLLKLSPLHTELLSVYHTLLAPLIRANRLRIVLGGADVGRDAVHDPGVDCVHLTGGLATHENLMWGPEGPERRLRRALHIPLLTKPMTGELGSVSPWIVVPGQLSRKELRFQAECIATGVINNAGCNCVATRVLVTSRDWPQRDELLDEIAHVFQQVPPRAAFYPGSLERFERFAGFASPTAGEGTLPWTLLRDVRPSERPLLFQEESFTCVLAETTLPEGDPARFLARAVDFVNEQVWGTLTCALTVPHDSLLPLRPEWTSLLERLRYGAVAVNHWPGLLFSLMGPPWGAYPGGSHENPQSGVGFVHNVYALPAPRQTLLTAPLTAFPKPFWFATHPAPAEVAWQLLELYLGPSWRQFLRFGMHAVGDGMIG